MPANTPVAEAIMRSRFTAFLSGLSFAALCGTCVAASPASDPSLALGSWVGRWSFSGQIYKTEYSDGHADTGIADCAWTANKGYAVCEYFSNDPPHDDLDVLSYSPSARTYKLVNIHKDRAPSYQDMTRSGNTWVTSRYASDKGKTLVIRTIFVFLTADKQTTTVEVSPDKGRTWVTMIHVVSVRAG
jgi:hypothetical protein